MLAEPKEKGLKVEQYYYDCVTVKHLPNIVAYTIMPKRKLKVRVT